jgi:hypothetical protein
MSAGLDCRLGSMGGVMRSVVAEGGLVVFGPFRDIVWCLEAAFVPAKCGAFDGSISILKDVRSTSTSGRMRRTGAVS